MASGPLVTRHDGVTPTDPNVAWTEDRTLAGDHVLRTYEDGSWALWHPAVCGAMGVDCDFDRAADAGRREDMPATVVVAIDPATQLLVPDLKAHWEDVVTADLGAS